MYAGKKCTSTEKRAPVHTARPQAYKHTLLLCSHAYKLALVRACLVEREKERERERHVMWDRERERKSERAKIEGSFIDNQEVTERR